MKSLTVILLMFLGIGLLTRKFNAWTRLILITVLVGVLLYLNLA